jgi:hypothetical protein
METDKMETPAIKREKQEKILLALLPYWDSLIPPMGLACLKGYLGTGTGEVKTVDANTEEMFQEIYDHYFRLFPGAVPREKRLDFNNLGKEVLRSHLMAHLHRQEENQYIEAVGTIINRHYYCEPDKSAIIRMNRVIARFYTRLRTYWTNLLEKERPTILGISVFKGTLPASLYAFDIAKEKYPHVKTVMGGGIFADQLAPGTPDFNRFLEKTKQSIDHLVVGEGEILLRQLVEKRLPPNQRVYSGKETGNQLLDISTGIIPDFSDFEIKSYPMLSAYTSRSCPYQCRFCSETLQWGKYRKKSAQQVTAEMRHLSQKYNSQLFLLSDSLLNPIVDQLALQVIQQQQSIYWDGYLRVENRAAETTNTLRWRKGGFYRARLGVESGSPGILEAMEKKITPAQIKNTVKALAAAGIKTTTYWIVGYPGETEDDFQQTLDLIEELKDDIYEAWGNIFAYFPGGQVQSGDLEKKSIPLYPPEISDMLMCRPRVIDGQPTRETTIQRLFRFIRHCREIGIPATYSLPEINQADQRWQKLHPNGVPPLAQFLAGDSYIEENKHLKEMNLAKNVSMEGMDFAF